MNDFENAGLSFNSALGIRLGGSACRDNAGRHLSGGFKGLTTLLASAWKRPVETLLSQPSPTLAIHSRAVSP
jgi:hypothetical protein